MYKLIKARTNAHFNEIKKLFLEYRVELGQDLCFQDFDDELKNIPGKYNLPNGELLLIYDEKSKVFAGCVGLRKFKDNICEMKRLFVRPQYRKHGYGKLLTEHIISIAKKLKYKFMILDSLEELKPAICLYKSFGFTIINAYYENPLDGVVYMRKELNK